ncbi:hypothetical protein BBO99_00009306 [Phytophthora kernoviae]|uniref:WRKY19-like zinc finger domain-containing protein n=2 Tax=Phytophthora kernoviae TaxID=325452 RepID=A0A3R7KPC2_9STRA|nr:hypothetical protein G195_011159 [Phytophthora kernoviae 00238/432]KAG2502839.1 hypothetical protein JM16_009578 [Phytophthora kernoviae]KAG2503612.1 hypothetical protein JM18_009605 [Phytophthora kernoviae]RLM96895.1 hypothetical protein BBI17_009687 [Phytophthora kernoviae]RLN73645.1 hypothetical protein BBO99_00009306 [Phytophthora kernoviae]
MDRHQINKEAVPVGPTGPAEAHLLPSGDLEAMEDLASIGRDLSMAEQRQEASSMSLPPPTSEPLDEHKFGLPFILNVPIRRARGSRQSALNETVVVPPHRKTGASQASDAKNETELSKEEKKRRRTCKHEGCHNYIVHKGLCCRHGCKEDGCTKKAKARGLCWAHGGGTKCRNVECSKVAVSNGFCWAHGGGKRCGYKGCIKPAYERTHNFCEKHFVQMRQENYCEL